MSIFEEELLEPVARHFRFQNAFKELPKNSEITIADIGCGPKIRAYFAMKKYDIKIAKYIGIDPLISSKILRDHQSDKSILLIPKSFDKKVPLESESVDAIIALAVLEHIDYPKLILNDIQRVLKKGGCAILTTPSPTAKSILEFLSYKLGLISEREIHEHKNYFTKKSLYSLLNTTEKIKLDHRYFEFGLNNLLVIRKK